eukprot:GSA25T00005828001.1
MKGATSPGQAGRPQSPVHHAEHGRTVNREGRTLRESASWLALKERLEKAQDEPPYRRPTPEEEVEEIAPQEPLVSSAKAASKTLYFVP